MEMRQPFWVSCSLPEGIHTMMTYDLRRDRWSNTCKLQLAAHDLFINSPMKMSEEIKNAKKNVPLSMVMSITINGILAFAMLLVVLFCLGDYQQAAETATGFPFIAVFANGTKSNGAATTMVAVIIIMEFASAIAALAAASRMTWSFARDHGLPGWKTLSHVGCTTHRRQRC